MPGADTSVHPPEDSNRIFAQAGLRLFHKVPKLRFALAELSFQEIPTGMTGIFNDTIYYQPKELEKITEEHRLDDFFLHMIIHRIFNHLLCPKLCDEKIWNLACDMAAFFLAHELTAPKSLPSLKHPGNDSRWLILASLPEFTDPADAFSLYQLLQTEPELVSEAADLFRMDDHSRWYHSKNPPTPVRQALTASIYASPAPSHRHFGRKPGSRQERMEHLKKAKYDYRSYLRNLMVSAEDLQIDPGSFDYLYYMYGLEHYGNMPLVEPLEYAETNKIAELVIAIDTSGSCDANVVAQFLSETRQILTDRENFFRTMNVHMIQCDSMIQAHTVLHSIEEWNHYIQNIKILGRGGTDFTPVFRYVNRLIEEKQFQNLKGLLYFTDGDGIYPTEMPPYQTAFVFLDQNFRTYRIPDWLTCLCLEPYHGDSL